jgi:hypothetical protein
MKKEALYAVFSCTAREKFTKEVIDKCLYFNSPEYGKLFRNKESATEFARNQREKYNHGRQYSRCQMYSTRYVVRKVDNQGRIIGVEMAPPTKDLFGLTIQD